MTHNVGGLAMAGHSKNLLPELQPNRITKVEVMIKKLIRIFSARTTDDSSTKADEMHVSPAIAKPNVTSRFVSSNITERLKSTDKHWSEMSSWEKIQAGPFLCIINPDEYDERWGKYIEYMIFYDDYEEYIKLKKFVIDSGRWAEFVHQ
jgi:hypothetical protein